MRMQDFLRRFLFAVFFLIGAFALVGAILCQELLSYVDYTAAVRSQCEYGERLKSLNADYDVLLRQFEKGPDIFDRIAPAALGSERPAEDTAYPKAGPEELAAAKNALMDNMPNDNNRQGIRLLLQRCCLPIRRVVLAAAGALLILVSFGCFGSDATVKKLGDRDNQKNGKNIGGDKGGGGVIFMFF